MPFSFSARSKKNLAKVHPDLVWVMARAIILTPIDFVVTEGARSIERQRQLVAEKKSKTYNSKHLIQADGYAHACDVAALVPTVVKKGVGGKPDTIKSVVNWETKYYKQIKDAVAQAARELGVKITWGGSWGWDSPHFQIDNASKRPKSLMLNLAQYQTASVA